MSEKRMLQHFLDAQRASVLAIVEGLDDTQLRSPVLPSGWTPLGMIEHLADAEQHWFQGVAMGAVTGQHNQEWEGEDISDLRWVALHLIEETARHAGHLDATRELLDGRTGLGPH